MYLGLNDRFVDRLAAAASLIALLSAAMLWHERLYPISMVVDLVCGLALASVFARRTRIASPVRMTVIAVAGLLIGVAAVYQTPLYANGFLVLGGVMVLSFTTWSGWRSWVLPVLAITSVLLVSVGVSSGLLNFHKNAAPDLNSSAIWTITAMTIALLAIASSGSIGDLKHRLNRQLKNLEEANSKLFLSAYTDPETGLGNRRRLEEVISSDLRDGHGGCLLVIELSGFRLYNALHGHVRGDRVLADVSTMLANFSTGGIFVSSFPGCQFGVWIPRGDLHSGRRFFEAFYGLFHGEKELTGSLGLSAGLVVSDQFSRTFNKLIQNAAVALADTKKKSGVACSVFSPEMAKAIEDANTLKLAVRDGLNSGGFYPVYQTKVNSRTGQVCGVEGLARMKPVDSNRAPGPGEFIPLIHAEGWMTEFGALMLKAIMKDVPHLVDMFGPDTKVSINVSPPLFLAAEFLPLFLDSLRASKADPHNVVIEITEEVFASSLEEIITVTNEIRKIGADISLDDFGSGFSSLSYLRAVHFDEIKIDRSFVQILDRDAKGNILLSAITDLGLALGSRMVAEGVETQAQLETVQNAGCEIIQGFFYSRPITLAELDRAP